MTDFIAIKVQIGNNIKKIRQGKELNIKTVCNDLEISPAAYGNIERGLTDINISRIVQLVEYFNVHVSTLLAVNDVANFKFNNGSSGSKQLEDVSAMVSYLLEEISFLRSQNEYLLKKE